jgi:hypothetical protein
MKQPINEIKRMQKLAGLITEGYDEDKIEKYEKYTYTLDGKIVHPEIAFYDHKLQAEIDGTLYNINQPVDDKVELSPIKGKTGMYTEAEEGNEIDVRKLVKDISIAKRTGSEIAVDGKPVTMWIAMIGRLKTENGTYSIYDIADGTAKLTIDGAPVELPILAPAPEPAPSTAKPFDTSAYSDSDSIFYRGGD